jgi:hypothetical protein
MFDFFLIQVVDAVANLLVIDTVVEMLTIYGVAELLLQLRSEQFLAGSEDAYMIQKSLDLCRCDTEDMSLGEGTAAGAVGEVLVKNILAEEAPCDPRQSDLDSRSLEGHECTRVGMDMAFKGNVQRWFVKKGECVLRDWLRGCVLLIYRIPVDISLLG